MEASDQIEALWTRRLGGFNKSIFKNHFHSYIVPVSDIVHWFCCKCCFLHVVNCKLCVLYLLLFLLAVGTESAFFMRLSWSYGGRHAAIVSSGCDFISHGVREHSLNGAQCVSKMFSEELPP